VLATAVSALEQRIQSRRRKLDARSEEQFDLARRLSEARFHLEELSRQRAQAETAPTEPTVVESYPTPLSRTVDGREAHFQLRSSLVRFIPLEKLLEEFTSDARRQAYKLLDQPELTGTIGPEGGFRLRYTLERVDLSPEMAAATGRGGSLVRLRRWTLIPASAQLGETVETALLEGSEFRKALSKLRPRRTTITIWTYPDSFAAFRRLKKELYHLGFSTAGRPLPHGTPISGSPEGTKSAEQ